MSLDTASGNTSNNARTYKCLNCLDDWLYTHARTHTHTPFTYHFLFRAQYTQLAEAHVEWWALVSAISLADNHNIDAARQRGLINALIQFFDGYQHLTCQLAHVVHGVRLEGGREQNISWVKGKTGWGCTVQQESRRGAGFGLHKAWKQFSS